MRRAGPGPRRKILGGGRIEGTFCVKRQGSFAGLEVDRRTEAAQRAPGATRGSAGAARLGGWPAGAAACSEAPAARCRFAPGESGLRPTAGEGSNFGALT